MAKFREIAHFYITFFSLSYTILSEKKESNFFSAENENIMIKK